MGRPLRTDAAGAWHHVMNRGAGRRVVFHTDEERTRFLELLGQVGERFEVEIHAFCLMGNHFHLLVRSRQPRLSEAMKWVASVFTREVNAQRGVDGAVFRGRFHSVHVQHESHLDWLFRYINANPLDLGWEGPLAEYPWSGLSATIGRGGPEWLCNEYARLRFGRNPAAVEAFVEGARSAPVHDSLQRGAPSWSDVAAAAFVSHAPGPDVHSAPDVLAAAVVSAIDRWSVDPASVRRALESSWSAFERQVDRSRTRVGERPELASLVDRIDDVLAITLSG